MACDHPFVCGNEIEILGWKLEGVGWYIFMICIALILQITANFVWLQNSQTTRELMKLKKDKRGPYYMRSLLWTGISTKLNLSMQYSLFFPAFQRSF